MGFFLFSDWVVSDFVATYILHYIFFTPLLVSAFQSPVGLQKGEMQMPQIWKKYSHGQFRLGFSSEGWSCVSDNTAPT